MLARAKSRERLSFLIQEQSAVSELGLSPRGIMAVGRKAGMGGPLPFPRDARRRMSCPNLPSAPSQDDGVDHAKIGISTRDRVHEA
jgi:hypothetical protein